MPAMPSGLNSTSTTKNRPNHSIQPVVMAPITSRATKKAAAPITGPQNETRPPPTKVIITT